jgi:ankyrin repeat protein
MSEFAQLLIATTKRGDTAGVRRLVEKGADIDQVDEIGRTALLTASLIDHLEIATVLLEQGADVNKPYKPVILSPSILAMPNAWVTPMCVAINGGQLATAQLLSSYGAARAFTIGTGTGTIFITAEELANRLRHAADFGITVGEIKTDYNVAMKRSRGVSSQNSELDVLMSKAELAI